ncbi:hypothetical protein ACHAWO_005486 [Cyclotella atomus]|uniref:Sulfotransferase domain-containing protein n=1 Tax=Cyclotella atomus TaxID=382360 RepID=A0ABD3QB81_9STRA
MTTHFHTCTKVANTIQHKKRRTFFYIAIILVTITSSLFSRSLEATSSINEHRSAASSENNNQGIPLWALENAKPLRATPSVGEEVALFWHIPKSGGTTSQTLATAAGKGRRFVPDNNQILVFNPYGTGKYVNVDTSSREGLIRAAEMKLVQSGKADIIFTTDVKFAVETLFDKDHPGRLFAIFRHPIHRLVSKFYYMQSANWERSYDPKLKDMTLLDWATQYNTDNNFFLEKLSGKMYYEMKERDLREAMRTLRKRFIVGLTEEMEESIRRFNIVMGVDYMSEAKVDCMSTYFGDDVEKKENSHAHPSVRIEFAMILWLFLLQFTNLLFTPKIEEGSPEWRVLYHKNELDIKLYEYVVKLFASQKDVIDEFTVQHLLHLEKKVTQLFRQVNRNKRDGGKVKEPTL